MYEAIIIASETSGDGVSGGGLGMLIAAALVIAWLCKK